MHDAKVWADHDSGLVLSCGVCPATAPEDAMFGADFEVGSWESDVQVNLAMLINCWAEHINTEGHAAMAASVRRPEDRTAQVGRPGRTRPGWL